MRLLLLLHAAAARMQWGTNHNNTRNGSKRRQRIERYYAKARQALPTEERLESDERWARAKLLGRGRKASLTVVRIKAPVRNFTYEVPNAWKLLDIRAFNLTKGSQNGTGMNARHYLNAFEKAKNNVEMQMKMFKVNEGGAPAPQDRIGLFVKRGSWDSDGFASLGRLLGVIVGIPLRILVLLVRKSCLKPLRARVSWSSTLNFTDDALRRGFTRALQKSREERLNELGQVTYRYEGPLERFFSRNYGLLVQNTREIRIVLKTAWRMPRQIWLFLKSVKWYVVLTVRASPVLNAACTYAYPPSINWPQHERLEAALLRALLAECRAYESRLGPKAAARRRRRLAGYHAQLRAAADRERLAQEQHSKAAAAMAAAAQQYQVSPRDEV